jgi:hypothetical protein
MLSITACAFPQPVIRLPKRLARIRRTVESHRLNTLRDFHEALKKAGKAELDSIKDMFKKEDGDEEEEEEKDEPKEEKN